MMNYPDCPKCVSKLSLRVGVGLGVALIGLNHLLNIQTFPEMVAAGLGPLAPAGLAWGYILPLLEVVGGVMVALGLQAGKGTWLLGISLVSIILGLLLKGLLAATTLVPADEAVPLESVMGVVQGTFLWLIALGLGTRCDEDAHSTKKKRK
ncbi:MAG TPA: hypothetical protein VI913_01785 [Candidatus Peribacteraceae bacterium]|nr:hypothetical protein [Candidatus Peribacteraceae bacterium]